MAGDLDDLDGAERRLCEALAAYFDDARGGQAVERDAWLASCPDLAEQLAEFLEEQDRLLRLTEPLRSVVEAVGDPLAPLADPGPGGHDGSPGFGDYVLLEEVARGGMGVVYRARQRRLGRVVALKVLRHGALVDADQVRRFRLEAEAVAALDHPNIVPVYDVGERGGFSFFAMKLIEGESLACRVHESAPDTRAAARLVATVARAVHHAHQRGLLHRDLKPSNIVVDAQGQPHITDFGLAKRVAGQSELTRSGEILGTPAYMAPEQASGDHKAVTTATDVYGLGAVLYALLTGRPPFQGDSVLETLDRVRHGQPEPPSASGRGVDRDLETICLKCLDKEPARRYGSALDLAEDLERWLAGEPILARPLSRWARTRRWARRRRWALAVATAALLILGLLGLGAEREARLRQARELTLRQRAELVKRDEAARHARYVRDIRRATRLIADGQPDTARSVLDDLRPATGNGDHRGFEWSYLRGLTDTGRAECEWVGHDGRDVYHVEYAPDGRRLATAGADGTARIWDAETRQLRLVLHGHKADVNWVSFDPDGGRVVTASDDGTARVWDASDGRQIAVFDEIAHEIVAALFTPDGRDIIAASRKCYVARWDAATRQRRALARHVYHIYKANVESMAVSPRGTGLALCVRRSNVSTVELHNIADGGLTEAATITFDGPAYGVAFAPDGRTLAVTSSGNEQARVYDAATGKLEALLKGPATPSNDTLAYSPDGRTLVVGGDDGVLRLWDVAGRSCRATLVGHKDRIWCVACSPDGRKVATAGRDGTIRLWDPIQTASSGRTTFHGLLRGSRLSGADVAFVRAGTHVLASNQVGDVVGCDLRDATSRTIRTSDPALNLGSVGLAPDGTALAFWELIGEFNPDIPRRFRLFIDDLTGGRGRINLSTSIYWVPLWSPDGRRLAVMDGSGDLILWDTATGRPLGKAPAQFREGASDPAFLPGGDAMFAFRRGGSPHSVDFVVWDPVRSHLDRRPMATGDPEAFAGRFVMAPDGRSIASLHNISLWRLPDLDERHDLYGHDGGVTDLAYSPDSRTLATASLDRTVRLWDVASGQELLKLEGHSGPVHAVAFADDGRALATCGDGPDGGIEVIVWHARDRARLAEPPPHGH